MNRELAKQLILAEEDLTYGIFTLYAGKYFNCDNDCCEDYFDDVEEALDQLKRLCDGDWSKVKCTSSS